MATETSGTPAKKTAKRSTSGGTRATRKSSSGTRSSSSGSDSSKRSQSAPRTEARPRTPASKVASEAKSELVALTGKDAEGVTGLERTEDGWLVRVEVVELRRIPDTTDVLALYEVQTDAHGILESYQRVRRYVRGVPDND
jgi:Gas vesicle synthesis protein GvpO